MSDSDVTDMTRGVYRRIYASYIFGQRINGLSLEAEAWFWRVLMSADDFGNARGDSALVHAATAGIRKGVEVENVRAWLREMRDRGLIRFYKVQGDTFLHVVGFLTIQPAGKNGKRVLRVPHSPWDQEEEAGLIPGNPGASSASHNQDHNHNQDKPATQASGEPAYADSPATSGPAVLTFPCCAGRKNKSTSWGLSSDFVQELQDAFPGVDVPGECRKALTYVKANPAKRKTANGMADFLFRWMSREQNGNRGGRPINGRSLPSDKHAAVLTAIENRGAR